MKEGRLVFGADGILSGVDGAQVAVEKKSYSNNRIGDGQRTISGGSRFNSRYKKEQETLVEEDFSEGVLGEHLHKPVWNSDRMKRMAPKAEDAGWSLYKNEGRMAPLKFSNGKTQEDVVKEVAESIRSGVKVVLLHGVCGTGKSAIALNIARELGRASIVVPVKSLQKQYEDDYMGNMSVYKKDGEQLSIAMITGRDNHDSLIKSGASCADPFLPDTIAISEKNYNQIREYYEDNPIITHKRSDIDLSKLKRIAIAPANPYWSPIVSADIELPLRDARKKKYKGLNGREFIFYHRKSGCSYFDQYQAYLDADVLIFNAAKYKIEVALDRKPATNVEIIDEADEFLDSFSTQKEINITRLGRALGNVFPESAKAQESVQRVIGLVKAEEQRVRAIGIDEKAIEKAGDTNFGKMLSVIKKDPELVAEIMIDEGNYANNAVEIAELFEDLIDESYVSYRMNEDQLYACIVTTNLSQQFKELVSKNTAFVFMSGTLHSKEVLKDIFGIEDFKAIEAEGTLQGEIDIKRVGGEFECKYENFNSGRNSREEYLRVLSKCLEKAKRPILVHVNAFEDLPSQDELETFGIFNLLSREQLKQVQIEDKIGKRVEMFKQGKIDVLFSTKCSRGVDFPGDVCRSVIFTKYPYPNVRSPFWKVLQKTHASAYWEFYRDKAYREFLQRIYRAVRSKNDYVEVLSPDLRVLDAVKELQKKRVNHG